MATLADLTDLKPEDDVCIRIDSAHYQLLVTSQLTLAEWLEYSEGDWEPTGLTRTLFQLYDGERHLVQLKDQWLILGQAKRLDAAQFEQVMIAADAFNAAAGKPDSAKLKLHGQTWDVQEVGKIVVSEIKGNANPNHLHLDEAYNWMFALTGDSVIYIENLEETGTAWCMLGSVLSAQQLS